MFAVFLFHIRPGRPEVDPWMWVVVGDIPSAYLPVSDASSSREAFETYVAGMRRWVEAARNGDKNATTAADIPPVNVPPTPKWAEKLRVRLDSLEEIRHLRGRSSEGVQFLEHPAIGVYGVEHLQNERNFADRMAVPAWRSWSCLGSA